MIVHPRRADIGVPEPFQSLSDVGARTLSFGRALPWGALAPCKISWTRRTPMNRILLAVGTVFIIDRAGLKLFLPITTMLLVSAVLSLLAWLMRR